MKTKDELLRTLRSIDHRGYPAYKSLKGSYDLGTYVLHIVHVQGDPFAAPSDLAVTVKAQDARWPKGACGRYETRVALQDMILRRFSAKLSSISGRAGGSGKSGTMIASRPGQEILDRSACQLDRAGRRTGKDVVPLPAGCGAGDSLCGGVAERDGAERS